MSEQKSQCAKCAGQMETGFVLDRNTVYVAPADNLLLWIEGEPERGILGGFKVAGKKTRELRADRCMSCGYVEFYASDEILYG